MSARTSSLSVRAAAEVLSPSAFPEIRIGGSCGSRPAPVRRGHPRCAWTDFRLGRVRTGWRGIAAGRGSTYPEGAVWAARRW